MSMWCCLNCKHLTPSGLHCAFCGRTRGRVCPRNHISPAYAERCITCGSSRLTTPTASVPLGWLTNTFVFAVIVVLLRFGFAHGVTIVAFTAHTLLLALSIVTGVTPV